MPKKEASFSDRPLFVATLAFVITAIIVVVSDIANLPGLLGGALNISGTWLQHASMRL